MFAFLAIPLLLVTANWVAPGSASPATSPAPTAVAAVAGSAVHKGLSAGKDAPQKIRPLKTACDVLKDFVGIRDLPAAPTKSSSISVSVKDAKGQASSLTIAAEKENENIPCDDREVSKKAKVDFAFVFVPDPTQSSVALETDRAFDAVRLAMTKQGFIPYKANVLPWRAFMNQEKDFPKKDSTLDSGSLALPGVWLFRSVTAGPEQLKLLFLIGDSPTVGISKEQFQNAVDQYRKLSNSATLEIVGPLYSGSINSLAHCLHNLCGPGHACPHWIVNATSGTAEVKGLNEVFEKASRDVATAHLDQIAKQDSMRSLCELLAPAGKTAILSEADTTFGQNAVCKDAEVFRYSRDLANLRAAYEADSDLMARIFPKSLRPDQLALRFGFNREPSDNIPVYAPENLAVSQQITLRHLARYFQRSDFANLIVVASDTLDTVFLSRFFQDENPNLRVAAFDSDALLDREAGAVSLRGLITISLQPTGSVATKQMELPSGFALGIYRACLLRLFGVSDPRNLVVSVVGYDGEWPLKALSPDGKKVVEPSPTPALRFFHWQRPVIAFALCLAWLCLFPWVAHLTPSAGARRLPQLVAPFCRPAANRHLSAPITPQRQTTFGYSSGTAVQTAREESPVLAKDTQLAERVRVRWVRICICTGACTLTVLVGLAAAAMTLPAKSVEYPAVVARYFYFGNGVSPVLPLAALLLAIHACAWSRVRSCYLSAYTYRPTPASLPFDCESPNTGKGSGREIGLLLKDVRRCAEHFFDSWLLVLVIGGSITAWAYDVVIHDIEIELGSSWTTRIWTILFIAVPILVANSASRFWLLWIGLKSLLRRLEFHPLRLGFTTLPDRISWTTIWSFGGMRPTMVSLQMSSDYLSAIDEASHSQANLCVRRRIDRFMECVHNGNFRVDPDALLNLQTIQDDQDAITEGYIQNLCANGYWNSHRIEGWHPDEPAGPSKPNHGGELTFRITRDGGIQPIEPRQDSTEVLENKLNKLKCEFIALQYAAFIRYAFMQLRNLLGFLVTASSLLFIAINVYPFQPIGTLTNFATFLFIGCAVVVVTAFYQMDRDHLLSRLSNTTAGKLDAGFGWRLIQFGSLPTVTFLATHFPPIGQALVKFAQIIPGLSKL